MPARTLSIFAKDVVSHSKDRHPQAASDHCARRSVFVVIRQRGPAPFYGITHVAEYKDSDSRHALPLFGIERLVEWLPCFGELIQVG
jgi:hypothetical protein